MAKKTPKRTCIACGKSGDKRDLLRVVRTPDGGVVFDESGKMAGRGAYVCKSMACFEKAVEKHLFDARLRTKVSSDDYGRLRERFRDFVQASAQAQANRDGE